MRVGKKKILFVVEIIVLLLLSFVLFVFIWAAQKFTLVNHQELDKDRLFMADGVNSGAAAGDKADGQPQDTTSALTGIDVIALVGLDTRDELDGRNSDTMIIACINHNEKSIKLVSLYRDTYLNVGDDYYGNSNYYTKANAAYNLGGPEQFLSMVNLNLIFASFGGTIAGMLYDASGSYLSTFILLLVAIAAGTVCSCLIRKP